MTTLAPTLCLLVHDTVAHTKQDIEEVQYNANANKTTTSSKLLKGQRILRT